MANNKHEQLTLDGMESPYYPEANTIPSTTYLMNRLGGIAISDEEIEQNAKPDEQ